MEKLKENQRISVLFMMYGILFCVCLITANVLETKQISFGPANMTAGLIVFPVSYIINDVVCEVWGYRRTRLLIWLGFAMNFMFEVPLASFEAREICSEISAAGMILEA